MMSGTSKLSFAIQKRVYSIYQSAVYRDFDYPTGVGVVDLEVASGTLRILALAGVVKLPDSEDEFEPVHFVNASRVFLEIDKEVDVETKKPEVVLHHPLHIRNLA
jgi:hypothetical protein